MAGKTYPPGMPTRRRDKDGIFWRDGWAYLQHKGLRVSLKTKDRAEAREAAKLHKQRTADPAHAAAHLTTVAQACAEFRDHAKTGENRRRPPSDATLEMYETHFGHFGRLFGAEAPLTEVDATAVDKYIAARREERIGKKPAEGPDKRRKVEATTVDKELGTLRQILRLGLRRGWYHLPLDRVLPETAGADYVPGSRHLTLEQVPLLLAALSYAPSKNQLKGGYRGVYRHKTPGKFDVKLTLYADGKKTHRYIGHFSDPVAAAKAYDAAATAELGARATLNFPEGEALDGRAAYCAYIVAFGADVVAAERAERFDLGDETHANLLPLIRGTKNAARHDYVPVIAVFGPFAELARQYLVKHGAFPPWGKQRCRDLERACRRAGIPRVTPRDLRRTHGKILAALGVDAQRIGEMLRHTTSRMAQITYAKPERADVRQHVTRQAAG